MLGKEGGREVGIGVSERPSPLARAEEALKKDKERGREGYSAVNAD